MKLLTAVLGPNPEILLAAHKIKQDEPTFTPLTPEQQERYSTPDRMPVYVCAAGIIDFRDSRYNVEVDLAEAQSLGTHWESIASVGGSTYIRADDGRPRKLLNEKDLAQKGLEFEVIPLSEAPAIPSGDFKDFLETFTANKLFDADRVGGILGAWSLPAAGWRGMAAEVEVEGVTFPNARRVTFSDLNYKAAHQRQSALALEHYKNITRIALEFGWPSIERPSVISGAVGELLGRLAGLDLGVEKSDLAKEISSGFTKRQAEYEAQPFCVEFAKQYPEGGYNLRSYCPVKALVNGSDRFCSIQAAFDITPDVIIDEDGWTQAHRSSTSDMTRGLAALIMGDESGASKNVMSQAKFTATFTEKVLNGDPDRQITYYLLEA